MTGWLDPRRLRDAEERKLAVLKAARTRAVERVGIGGRTKKTAPKPVTLPKLGFQRGREEDQ